MVKCSLGMSVLAVVAGLALGAQSASAAWTPFAIRDSAGHIGAAIGTGGGVAPTYLLVADTLTVNIPLAGQKVGYGTSQFDGQPLSAIGSMTYSPTDPGPGLTPYTNVWVTDGTHYAAITPFDHSAGDETEVLGKPWSSLNVKIAETVLTTTGVNVGAMDWLYPGAMVNNTGSRILENSSGTPLTFADLASNLTVQSPDFSTYLIAGTGAARGGFGLNLIFGDTSSNYNAALPYIVSDVTATAATPEPASIGLLAMGAVGLMARRRRRSV